jgi:hypothetical protein
MMSFLFLSQQFIYKNHFLAFFLCFFKKIFFSTEGAIAYNWQHAAWKDEIFGNCHLVWVKQGRNERDVAWGMGVHLGHGCSL